MSGNFIKKIKIYLFILKYYQYKFSNYNRKAKSKAVLINIKNYHYKRYLYLFVKFLHLEGYTIYLNPDFISFYELRKDQYISFLFREKIINLNRPPDNLKVILIDDAVLSADYFSEHDAFESEQNSYFVPMQQHPLMYHTGWWNEPIKKVRRKKSLFMAGNFDETVYAPIEKDGVFKTMSRLKVYSFLNDLQLLYPINSMNDLRSFIEDDNIDNKVILINRLKANVPMNELRHILGQFDFYFALPGVVMPFSHNIIEAMSAACVPFIQEEYAQLFKPPLYNGKQAITFTDNNDLESRLNYLFSLSKEQIGTMRNEVGKYYTNYLTPSKVVASIERINFNKIYLQAEHHSVDLLKGGLNKTL